MFGFFVSAFDFSAVGSVVAIIAALLFVAECLFLLTVMMRCPHYAKLARNGKVWFSAARPPVSVILYTEDDVDAVRKSLPALLEQVYPSFEVIVVNDGASENVKDFIKPLVAAYDNLYYTFVPAGAHSLSRKKLAITIGIKAARYDIVAVTEAGCRPVSKKWLECMARNFTTDIEIVIGNTKVVSDVPAKWHLKFYRLLFKMKFLGCAVINRPFMGEGCNMFFLKGLFFKSRGFSEHLNIVFGEDDVFINRLMTDKNTRAEFSPEALVEYCCENGNKAVSEMRLRREFTHRFLKRSSSVLFSFGRVMSFCFYLSLAVSVIYGFAGMDFAMLSFAVLLFVLWWLVLAAVCRSNSKVLSSSVPCLSAIFYDMVSPFIDCRFRYLGHKTVIKNYTWRIK